MMARQKLHPHANTYNLSFGLLFGVGKLLVSSNWLAIREVALCHRACPGQAAK